MEQNSDDEQTRDRERNTSDATTETIKPVLRFFCMITLIFTRTHWASKLKRLFCMITLIFTRNHWASKLHKNGNGT